MLQLCVCQGIEHLGSLESTQEARVALGCASRNSYNSFVLSKLKFPRVQYLDIRTLTHELIVNSNVTRTDNKPLSPTSRSHTLDRKATDGIDKGLTFTIEKTLNSNHLQI